MRGARPWLHACECPRAPPDCVAQKCWAVRDAVPVMRSPPGLAIAGSGVYVARVDALTVPRLAPGVAVCEVPNVIVMVRLELFQASRDRLPPAPVKVTFPPVT